MTGEPKRWPTVRKSANTDLPAGLYVTATPIGNARDVTLRALDVLEGCDLIVAEDTRVTAKLLAIYGIAKPLSTYNDHNAARERPRLLARLKGGARLALVSDAGTPLISDPGYRLVREALANDLPVHAIPGASAVLSALAVAGLPTDRFFFAGFVPAKDGERHSFFAELKNIPATLVLFESPRRLADSLAVMAEVLGKREAVVARELTKLHEEIRRGRLGELALSYADADTPKGEITVLVAPPEEAAVDFARLDSALDKALEFMPVRAAVDLLAEVFDVPRREVYGRALAKKSNG